MTPRQERIYQTILWLLPTWAETVVYFFLSVATMALSSQSFLKSWLYVPKDFNIFREVLHSIDSFLPRILGERIGGSLSLGIFWGFIGMIVYLIIWLFMNFSTELNNELVLSKYVHPTNTAPQPHVRQFIAKLVFRMFVLVIMVFYINLILGSLLPFFGTKYRLVIAEWSKHNYLVSTLLLTIAGQMLSLHAITVLVRLLLLRKRVFDN